MILKLLLEDIKTYIIDPEGEYKTICKQLGGQMIDVGAAVDSRINPFHIFGQMQDEEDLENEASINSLILSKFSSGFNK